MEPTSTLPQKLRYYSVDKVPRSCEALMHQAAEEIERLRSALEIIASCDLGKISCCDHVKVAKQALAPMSWENTYRASDSASNDLP